LSVARTRPVDRIALERQNSEHAPKTTTEVYVRADPTEKLVAFEAVVPPSLRKGKFRPPDKLLALLKGKP
jgi:hypothetical protein